MAELRPRIVGFLCNWCSYAGADHAGGLKLDYPADVRLVRVMCSGRVDPQFVLAAFREGADGVMVLGCHPGDCHYREGNLTALRRTRMLSTLLPQLGVHPDRLLLDWVAAGEGEKFHRLVTELSERVAALGPLELAGRVEEAC
jgi:F420-non-reducing hydrogenase iron-sulfur subunit